MHPALPVSFLGTHLDRRYRLDRLLGEGASAWVFAAQDTRLDRVVAVKLMKASADAAPSAEGPLRRRFVNEGRTLAKLVHPHIVSVHDAGETQEGLVYLIMELSGAGTLEAELVRRARLSVEETMELLIPLLGALACAHDLGIIHRDIKPANIALLDRHGKPCCKLLDFGIAKCGEGTTSSGAVGTPSFMAPEQARGEALTAAVDVWAMGVVFYRCLSGTMPFEAPTSTSLLLKLVQGRAPRFDDVCPGLGASVAHVLDRALEPQIALRHQDMRSFAFALAHACSQDGVRVTRRPDPTGLPAFETWLDGADSKETQPLSREHPVATVLAAAREPAIRRNGRNALWLVAAGAAGASLTAAFHMGTGEREQEVLSQPVVARHAELSPRPTMELDAPTTVSSTAAVEAVLPVLPAAASAPAAPRRLTVRKGGGAVEKAKPAAPSSPDAGFIMKWDW